MERMGKLHEEMPMPDRGFLFKLNGPGRRRDPVLFENHWHESMEIIYMTEGEARFQCNSRTIRAGRGDLVIINSCDLHGGYLLSESVSYYCAIFDTELLRTSAADICGPKYIDPIREHRIMFKNLISRDDEIERLMGGLIDEYRAREPGYELAVKGLLFQIIAILLRRHRDASLSEEDIDSRRRHLVRMEPVVRFLEENCSGEVRVNDAAALVNMSRYHFCRSFKRATGRTLSDYVNQIRVNKAEYRLKNSTENITRIAMDLGFNDINYFSRTYKRYKGQTPSESRRGKT